MRDNHVTESIIIRIGSTPTFLYFDLYLYFAYAAHYVYIYIYAVSHWTSVIFSQSTKKRLTSFSFLY